MSLRLRDVIMRELPQLRHEPIDKRIRATLGGATVIDTTRALLVWEPRRVVPTYAVPEADLDAEVVAGPAGAHGATGWASRRSAMPQLGDRPVLDPSIPFSRALDRGRAADGARRRRARPRRSEPPTRTSTAT